MADFCGTASPISQDGLARVTDLLGTSPIEVWTILAVETKGFGFLADRRPAILFERHIFHKQTNGAFDAQCAAVSCPTPGGYIGGAAEYDRLAQAIALNRHAALASASWGIGQVMGFNFQSAGFASPEEMVAAMVASEDAQLLGMARFVRSCGLHTALAKHDWAALAKGYNGPDYAKNQYDTMLAGNFQKLTVGPLPDVQIRQAQAYLTFLGFDLKGIDGVLGKRTRAAIVQFRQDNKLGSADSVDDDVVAALAAKVASLTTSAAGA